MASLKDQFSDFFELPDEIILDAPLVMLVDQKKIYIENHKGIALYQNDLIKVRINSGYILVKGEELEIDQIETENIYISGKITGLEYEKRGRGR